MVSILSLPDEILSLLIGMSGDTSLHAIRRTCLRLQRVPVDALEIEIVIDGVRTVRKIVFLTPSAIAEKLRVHREHVDRSDMRPTKPNHASLAYPQQSNGLHHDDILAPYRTYPRESLHVDKMWETTHAAQHTLLNSFEYDVNTHGAHGPMEYDGGGNLLPCNGNDITNRLRIRTRFMHKGQVRVNFDDVPTVRWAVLICPLSVPYYLHYPNTEDDMFDEMLYDMGRDLVESVCFQDMQISLSYGALRVLLTVKMFTDNGNVAARRCRSDMQWVDTWVAEM
jgi:hypothetical protein